MTSQGRKQLSPDEALTVARIVRVNHAGEFGAIRIYSAQIIVASKFYPDIVPALATMLGHEKYPLREVFRRDARAKFAALSRHVVLELRRLVARTSDRPDGPAGDLDLHRGGRSRGASPSRRSAPFSRRPRSGAGCYHPLDPRRGIGASPTSRGPYRDPRRRCPFAASRDHIRDRRGHLAIDLGRFDPHGASVAAAAMAGE